MKYFWIVPSFPSFLCAPQFEEISIEMDPKMASPEGTWFHYFAFSELSVLLLWTVDLAVFSTKGHLFI